MRTMWGMGNWIGRLWLLACVLGIAFGSGVAQDAPAQPTAPQQQAPPAPQPPHTPQSGREESNPGKIAAQKTKEATIEAADLTRKAGEAALIKARDWESGWVTGIYVPRGQQRVSLSEEQRRQLYLQQTLTTPGAYMKRMFAAGIDQVRGAPQQWDDGWGGYVERFASREGQFITANSLAALGNAALKYEPRYDQCRCRGLWRRTGHAVVRNFITYDRSEQHLRPQLALYGGAFGGGLVSTAWKPHPRNGFAEGGRAMLGQAGYGALLNLFIEFAGDINRKLGAKK
ncbi:MAG TPA: hypothetical protein VKA07_09950 [Candidatus Sulfotelmatobacter sp.]|nr:hypothetical protein [Candidatus Sulfotelmatobacter sp.]